jgi:two-component system, chemotaxis family, sensor kinase CheA
MAGTDDHMDFTQFISEYVKDAGEGFQEINNALLTLEKDNARTDCLDEIFRVFHSLKSSSRMLEFANITDFAHYCEDLMDRLRKGGIPVNREAIDILFEINDILQAMVAERAAGKEESETTVMMVDDLKKKIHFLGSKDTLARQGIIVINENGVIEVFNAESEKIFGHSAPAVKGRNIGMLMPELLRSEHDERIGDYLNTGVSKSLGMTRQVTALRSDHAEFPMELTVNEIMLGDRRLFLGIVRDMSGHEPKAAASPAFEKIQTIRVNVDLLDALFNLTGELIITRNRIKTIVSETITKQLKDAMASMDHIIADLQEKVSSARMVAVDEVFQKFPRMIRDLAREKNKEVEIVIEGGDIELDKSILDAVGEPIIHLLRNAVDHGLESPERRRKVGKDEKGTIRLVAKRAENHIMIEIEDDGSGIDTEALKEMALKKGFVTPDEARQFSEKDAIVMLFKPGFSSASEVTGISGRGVGLDVVKTATEKLGGFVEIATEKGSGTRFSLKLPISPAIMQTLMVRVGGHVFIIPSDMVLETLEISPEDLRDIKDRQVLILRNQALPFARLNEFLNIPAEEEEGRLVALIIYRGDKFIAIGVNEVIDQVENIIKPFDTIAQNLKGFSGGVILPDGRVALLIDIPALFRLDTLEKEKYQI